MQFVIIGKDGIDDKALERRFSVREEHIKNTDNIMENMLFGVATLNDNGDMNGSIMIVDFPSREELDKWLENEPYVKNNVWQEITVLPCKVGPSFL